MLDAKGIDLSFFQNDKFHKSLVTIVLMAIVAIFTMYNKVSIEIALPLELALWAAYTGLKTQENKNKITAMADIIKDKPNG